MLMLLVTVFIALSAPSAAVQKEEVCYGRNVKLPENIHPIHYKGQVHFSPSNKSRSEIVMEDGKATDPRIKIGFYSISLKNVNRSDEGVYYMVVDGRRSPVLELKVLDCAQKIIEVYLHNWEHTVSGDTPYVEYTRLDNQDEAVIVWNITNPQINAQTRGRFKNNVWRISDVTQADNGFYNFRKKDWTLESRVLLIVEEQTRFYERKVNEPLFIANPWGDGPWTVTFKNTSEQVTVIKDNQLFNDKLFSGRITIRNDGIKINPVEYLDSGTFEFRDKQGNLALSLQVEVIQENHSTVTYIVVGVVALLLLICCCCCCKKKCCKKNKSSAAATEGTAGVYHDNSAPAAPGPPVYYHGTVQPTGPSYPNAPYPSVHPPQPVNPPDYSGPAAASIVPPPTQPNPAVYPPQPTTVYPPQPTTVYPPQPANEPPLQPTNELPPQPQPSLYPPLSEVGSAMFQGSAAAPTFSSDVLSSDAEPRFQLKGMSFPSVPPLSSDPPTNYVYNSEKLNFL